MIKISMLVLVVVIASDASAATVEMVRTCQLAAGASNTVKVTREHQISDTYVYKLHYAGKTQYFFNDENDSRGGPVNVICAAGKKERALVASGEFTANYRQGFALIYNRATGTIERLDFAEKGAPEWLYLGKNQAIVILPTQGAGENGGSEYVAYRHVKGKRVQPDPKGVDVPAPPPRYDAIRLAR